MDSEKGRSLPDPPQAWADHIGQQVLDWHLQLDKWEKRLNILRKKQAKAWQELEEARKVAQHILQLRNTSPSNCK